MFNFSFKNAGNVLRYLISLKHDFDNQIEIPDNILTSLKDVSENDFLQYIFYLEDCNYIKYELAEIPQKDNFVKIEIRPHALSFFAEEEQERKRLWKDTRRWWFTTSIAVAGAVTGIIALILS